MNKLEAAEGLAAAVEAYLKAPDVPVVIEVRTGKNLLFALHVYRLAPAMPSPERILEAMEFFRDGQHPMTESEADVYIMKLKQSLDILAELRKAMGK